MPTSLPKKIRIFGGIRTAQTESLGGYLLMIILILVMFIILILGLGIRTLPYENNFSAPVAGQIEDYPMFYYPQID